MSVAMTTIIDAQSLHARLNDPTVVIVDARFNLFNVDEGRASYLDGHVPGAVYAHLDDDLSGPPLTDAGRHPMPSPQALEALFSRLGVDAGSQVVAYDQRDGMLAARVWWMLRYMGHEAVAVLDGGWKAWTSAGYGCVEGEQTRPAGAFHGTPRRDWLVSVDQVAAAPRLVDSRDPRRYRGENEPLDPVAGHIPGALNRFHGENLDAEGCFLPPGELARGFSELLAGTPVAQTVFYCGSGVTACHSLLAACHAGLGDGRLYAGSWSEWCSDPKRPVATGPEAGSMK
ncbi:MAG: sulfurtransferase [Gammaproteobacteria bacterium]|jgi:thiosulfate/3-mercaptopyruvate sulfurtransferase|nr:sulfurtransferase [Gammaproteobacteria bacterium]NCF82444.1 sulfurtransferase [Pseudomonadota bacterium]